MPAKPDNWEKVQDLFFAAADLPAAEQHRFLDEACRDNLALRRDVDSLLAADRTHSHDIDQAVKAAAQEVLGADPVLGTRFGPWRVSREIGRGGMGIVYLVVRDDAQFQKQAALKLIRAGMDTAELLLRFRHERQILASLDHPYIARLIDGGTTPEGRPFLVMEYVEGLRIESWCGQAGLSVEDRCRLFLKVCEAVSYAHRSLVVHRDLKPGNILIAADGSPKLLDFGVAKLLAADRDPGLTATGPALTPDYASPEQILGKPITTAADIYSLGAILYQLLSCAKPHRLGSATPAEIQQAVCQTQIPRPSAAVDSKLPNATRLRRTLAGDLDNIVMMAMRKEPERRYSSVDQFAGDIRRHLDGHAVLARQNSVAYRTRKFLHRRRFELAGTFTVVASLVVGIMMALSQGRQAETARQAAESQRKVAEAQRAVAERERAGAEAARLSEAVQHRIADEQRDLAVRESARAEQRLTDLLDLADRTLFDIHDAIATLPGAIAARQRVVRTTLGYLESLEKSHGLDDRMRLALGAAYLKIGATQGDPTGPSLQDFDGAQRSYRKAEAVLAPLYGRRQDDPTVILRWVQIEASLADLTTRNGHPREAAQAYTALLPIAHKLGQVGPSDVQQAKQEANMLHSLSYALRQSDDVQGSLARANQAIALWLDLVARFPADADLKRELGSTYASAAISIAGDPPAAARYYEQSIAIREQVLLARPDDRVVRRDLLVVYGNYSRLLETGWRDDPERRAQARAYSEKSVALARELVKADPRDMTARYDLGVALSRLGMVEPTAAGLSQSLETLRESIALIEPVFAGNPKSASIAEQLAVAQEFAGQRLLSLGQTAAAAEQFRKSMATVGPCAAVQSGFAYCVQQTFTDEEALALLDSNAGDHGAARALANSAVARAQAFADGDRKSERRIGHLAKAYFVLASVSRATGEKEQARVAAEKAVSLWRTVHDPAVLAFHRKAMEEAEAMLREAAGGDR
jgi:eukaryotic-like serine/threonine-protein kinase